MPSANGINGSNGVNGAAHYEPSRDRAGEVSELVSAVQDLLIPFIRSADEGALTKGQTNHSTATNASLKSNGTSTPAVRTSLVEQHPPEEVVRLLNLALPDAGAGKEGLLQVVDRILKYSVNTWDQGFLDKLYASTNAVGVVSELILAVLNTNLHVFQVSPALTVVEKTTGRTLASLFGFTGPHAGGISQQGGSASNTTSIVIARNYLFPETKIEGNGPRKFVLFTSQHGHYSLEKAAQICGFGSTNIWPVPVDAEGRMIPEQLEALVVKAKNEGCTPFYVNATAGTTVLGSYDLFDQIADICQAHGLWMHVDGSWGGPAVFSEKQKHKLKGAERADSLAVNPHKMLGVPVTCSFLLGQDLRKFHKANTLPAGYLFHNTDSAEVWDLADLTLQCGRRGDSLKLALGWIYYGKSGYAAQIDHAFDTAAYMAQRVASSDKFALVSQNPPPCLQVCFYYVPLRAEQRVASERQRVASEVQQATGAQAQEQENGTQERKVRQLYASADENTAVTRAISHKLIAAGFMVDFAPGGDKHRGCFLRVVVNVQTRKETVDALIAAVERAGAELEL
ncbi:PLP-dependent transferase [Xylona heveae TC161]|uniref:PLP-dependent transferase n=1 Tax=Xylona heveae (strain CBS 132557 / TC161) TaxID=1328760 RepID=A0A165GLC4_XYLHT|nr:PLP-dependent transferase [Xylona heveae TC161]KZF22331.1 PLP-dependent transferase [Xylona heveae TC161]